MFVNGGACSLQMILEAVRNENSTKTDIKTYIYKKYIRKYIESMVGSGKLKAEEQRNGGYKYFPNS